MPVIVPAMPVPVIVNPTCSGVNRRPPEGTPPVPTDYAPDNQADRPGDHQARAGTENRADVIRVRTSRTKGDHQNRRCSQGLMPFDWLMLFTGTMLGGVIVLLF
jgi:hypothetical protein